ncbi:MAG: SMP-30/gluconolactonase/LRE family protein [Rhodothermales bacterium]|nr:SMP-30/gluconolactonase/LRE family protein [Rhodothermales bacterium]
MAFRDEGPFDTHRDRFFDVAPSILLLALLMLAACTGPPPETGRARMGHVERLDPRLDALVDPDARFEVLSSGHAWTEGPVWVADGAYLLFSDIPPNTIFRWKEGEGAAPYLTPSGYTGTAPRGGETGSNALLLDPQGRLVLAQHGDRRLARMEAPLDAPAPRFTTLADRYDGRRFNSPNDAVFAPDGALYFTDPPYGLEHGPDDPARELPFQGVYRRDPGGAVTLLTDSLTRPNGIAFSPDARTLYVANSDPEHAVWMAYDVRGDGTLANGRVFFDVTPLVREGRKGLPDGLKLDRDGHLFATGPGGVLVFAPDGTHLGTLHTTQATSNAAFGGDGRTLYVTADDYLLRIPLRTTGDGFPPGDP